MKIKLLALLAVFLLILACNFAAPPSATSTPNPTITATPTIYATATRPPTITPRPPTSTPAPDCYSWDAVTPQMVGQTLCIYGTIYEVSSGGAVTTRFNFSNQRNDFFVYSTYGIPYDPASGKWIGADTCIQVTAEVKLIKDVPYMDMEKVFYYWLAQPCEDIPPEQYQYTPR